MDALFKPLREGDEYFSSEGCFILELCNTSEDPAASITRARVMAGATTRWHRVKGTVERYLILKGVGLVEVGEQAPRQVHPGDVVIIPPSCRQRITNIGPEELVFLAVCTPRFVPEAYEETEGDSR